MLETHELPSLHLNTVRRLTVWMPPRARARRAGPYPVLYLNDGQNLFDPARAFAGNTWRVAETATRLVRTRRVPPMIIVGIDHGGVRRNREYLPVEDALNPTAKDPLGREYAEFVTREVMPFIARHYPIARGASNTGFGGSSVRRDRRAQHRDDQAWNLREAARGKPVTLCGRRVPAWEGVEHPAMARQDLSWCRYERDTKCGAQRGNRCPRAEAGIDPS